MIAKVLIVDDNKVCLKLISRIISTLECECLEANSAINALSLLENIDSLALILLDVQMPGMNGFELAESIRLNDCFNKTPIIFLTGETEQNAKNIMFKSYETGAVDFLLKPIDAKILLQKTEFYINSYNNYQTIAKLNRQMSEKQAQIIQFEKMTCIGQLAGGIAHEINNPACGLSNNIEVINSYFNNLIKFQNHLLEIINQNDKQNEIQDLEAKFKIEYIQNDIPSLISDSNQCIQRITDVVNTMSNFSKSDQNHQIQYPICDCIDSSIKLLYTEHKHKCKIQFVHTTDGILKCSPSEISQAIVNIILNAIEAIETQGEILIELTETTKSYMVSITDNGIGISNQLHHKIYEPFYTTKNIQKHKGLGLTITSNIMKKYHGSVTHESTPNQSTCFTLHFPKNEK